MPKKTSSRSGRGRGRGGAPTPPYSRDGRKERFEVILAAEDLEAYTHIKSRDKNIWPSRERGGLPIRMVHESEDIYSAVVEANELDLRIPSERVERLSKQRRALTKIKLLNHHIEFAYLPPKQWISKECFDYWTDLVEECRKRVAGWYKSDKNRAEELERQERDADLRQLADMLDGKRNDRVNAKV